MPVREFVDPHGVRWRVSLTQPTLSFLAVGEPAVGRLTFVAGAGPLVVRRHLSPAPEGWEQVDDHRLATLCLKAWPSGARGERDGRWPASAPRVDA